MLNTLGGVNTKKKIIIVSTLLLVISLSVFILGNKSKKTTCQYDSSQKDYQIRIQDISSLISSLLVV